MRFSLHGIGLLVMMALLAIGSAALAAVKGPCGNCHTMHNSQNGVDMVNGGKGVQNTLLVNDCVGCHSNAGNNTIVDLGNGDRIPIVFNLTKPTYPPNGNSSSVLAGGNFYWVAQPGGNAMGHNVYGIAGVDDDIHSEYAPGSSTACMTCHNTLARPDSGCKGCHYPRHHARGTSEIVGADGGWYRFLGALPVMLGDPATYGVKGIEDEDWEQNPSASRHNGYFGTKEVYVKEFMPYLTRYTIGQFCSGCHGNFHHEMNASQPASYNGAWLRHPSDVVIPNRGEYAAIGQYNPMAPVAKTELAGKKNFPTVELDHDTVTCISCHRAHGSPYPDMLRWDYNTCVSGGNGTETDQCGCFVCHTTKDD